MLTRYAPWPISYPSDGLGKAVAPTGDGQGIPVGRPTPALPQGGRQGVGVATSGCVGVWVRPLPLGWAGHRALGAQGARPAPGCAGRHRHSRPLPRLPPDYPQGGYPYPRSLTGRLCAPAIR